MTFKAFSKLIGFISRKTEYHRNHPVFKKDEDSKYIRRNKIQSLKSKYINLLKTVSDSDSYFI